MANEAAAKLRDNESGRVSDNSEIALKRSTVQALINPSTDAMYDLSQEQITAISLYEAINTAIIPIHGVMIFLNRAASLSASRDRLGRQEAVNTIIPRPVAPSIFPQQVEQQQKSGGLLGFLKKKRNIGGDQNAQQ
jgi:hypothetical protein